MHHARTIARFEYTKTIKRVGFWIGTLVVPLFIAILGGVIGYSGSQDAGATAIDSLTDTPVAIIDATGSLGTSSLPANVTLLPATTSATSARELVRSGTYDALVTYPADLASSSAFAIFARDRGVIGNGAYQGFARSLLETQVRSALDDPLAQTVLAGTVEADATFIDAAGERVPPPDVGQFVLPLVGFFMFFIAVFIGAQYLLQSVAEEKENRMIETILSIVSPGALIYGKIIGLSVVVGTQLLVWLSLGVVALVVASGTILDLPPLPLAAVLSSITPLSILVTVLCILLGFLLFASVMVGVGAIGTSARESQQLSAIFIMSAVIPIYFSQFIIADPGGFFAQFFTYFPFSSALIIMVRHAIDALPLWQLGLGLALNVVYVVLAFFLARKLFELGMLMYGRKPSLSDVYHAVTYRSSRG